MLGGSPVVVAVLVSYTFTIGIWGVNACHARKEQMVATSHIFH